ncbi:MAG: tRNA (guanosine(46)-N7)-methyltransferase TrmB [Candidatus Lambdaproteobacteria bacterium RIFOXYD1_FULL_56_27]|uniref:tRNA (guanine-N(7)-)-methyltransferase n=1 Tax=Candidatus Lambdaproteobacteria bacterium RIFOXYD2_FULL_56_26 TaxID=1817773 RepID=A0A1F6GSD9_9PROT|nr:MAG: tRNA (guanosine(46)-N7)-methyltransferase TrmB [Candidatus Lambdaproteobacteria bacterium RIFOXYD2_FULL_56_26]OGH01368.1 MAG: tRNA (guanosine(46)-N7)-methyltransferase TrmB [Candidatus Lambdaproteobacteria bacterium RIFOXYC1_FULL_56_13]OGH06909.1 MAG: tRNA (guanosine(46)-N7)-methyltransferase TrmB [Candidatus Lambdaproteobacteria bacterium RIFOXYD1_FULL_56_27]
MTSRPALPNLKRNNPYILEIQNHQDQIWFSPEQAGADLADFVSGPGALRLDLGCGAGNFLRSCALAEPQARFVGFELRYKRLVVAARKFKKSQLQNVRLAKARAEDLTSWFAQGTLDRVHVNFPDPWPKARQQKHRLLGQRFLADLKVLLKKEGEFWFKTDHKEYFEWALGQIEACGFYEVVELSWDLHHSPYQEHNQLTEFEGLFLSQGLPVYHLKAILKA